MRKWTLWWTQFPSVHVHCGPQKDGPEARIHYAEWVRDRDAGHLFAGTFYGLLAHSISYNGGRVDRFCDTGPSTEDLPFYSSFLVAAYHTLWRFDLGWHRISYRASQWERLPRVLPRLPRVWTPCDTWLPWSNEFCQCDTFAVAWGRWCYVQLRCLDYGADLLDSGGHDFPRSEHLVALQSSREKGGDISKSGARGAICEAQKVGDFGDLWSQRRMLDQPDQRTEGTIFLPLLSMNQDVVGEAIKVPNAILREVRHPTRHVSPERLRKFRKFVKSVARLCLSFVWIILFSLTLQLVMMFRYFLLSICVHRSLVVLATTNFRVNLCQCQVSIPSLAEVFSMFLWRGNVPPNNSEHAQKSWKQSARSSSHQWNSVMINDGWWKDGLTPFLRSLESLDSIGIFVRCFCSKKSTKIILIVSLLGDRAEVSLLADDINKEPLSPDPCNIISFECREESWGWVICALFRGYNVIFAESMFVGLALGCTVPGICKSYQIVSSRTEKWLPISPENPSSLRRFCLGFVGSRLWYFTILYIIIYHILVSHLHLLAPTVYTSTCITIGRGCVCREKCGMHEFLRSNTGTLCLIQLGNKLASLHMRAVFFLFCCMVSLLYALCIRK